MGTSDVWKETAQGSAGSICWSDLQEMENKGLFPAFMLLFFTAIVSRQYLKKPRLASNLGSSCLWLWNADITDRDYHTKLCGSNLL